MEMEGFVRDVLKRLTSTPRVTGTERFVHPLLKEVAEPYSDAVETDPWGNLTFVVNPGNSPVVMVAAHVDQIGLMITDITEDGLLRFTGVGWDARVLYGMRVKVLTDEGEVKGVITTLPPHVFRAFKELAEKKLEIRDLAIDVGADSRKEAEDMGIERGSYAIPDYDPISLGVHRFSAPGLDNASGVASMLTALRLLRELEGEIRPEVRFVATIQEEIGLRGAQMIAQRERPDVAIILDVTFAKQPMLPIEYAPKLGKGPAIGKGPIYHWEIVSGLLRVARGEGIPYQIEPDFRGAGTDTWALQVARGGVRTALISIPLRSMHSPVEVVDLRDVGWSGELLAKYLKSI